MRHVTRMNDPFRMCDLLEILWSQSWLGKFGLCWWCGVSAFRLMDSGHALYSRILPFFRSLFLPFLAVWTTWTWSFIEENFSFLSFVLSFHRSDGIPSFCLSTVYFLWGRCAYVFLCERNKSDWDLIEKVSAPYPSRASLCIWPCNLTVTKGRGQLQSISSFFLVAAYTHAVHPGSKGQIAICRCRDIDTIKCQWMCCVCMVVCCRVYPGRASPLRRISSQRNKLNV